MKNRTPPTTPKPEKPWPEFPLYWHSRGYWMKKYRGQELRYESDPHESYKRWLKDKDAMDSGGADRVARKRYALSDAINLYLTRQKRRMEGGELSKIQFAKCRLELEIMLPKAISAKTPLDSFRAISPGDDGPGRQFGKIKKRAIARGLSAAHRHIVLVRAALDYAAGKKLMLAPDYGDDFDPPSSDRIDQHRHKMDVEKGERTWTVGQLRRILIEAKRVAQPRTTSRGPRPPRNAHLHAQILLALFAGFASDDCSAVPDRAVDSERRIVKFPRVKNGLRRMAWLPDVAIDAIEHSQKYRAGPANADAGPLLFRTDDGARCNVAPIHSDDNGILKVGRNDTIGQNFKRLLKRLGLQRHRAGFKTLRAMCRTLLVGCGIDDDIIRVIMGRKFRYPVDDYYIRGELRRQLVDAAKHIESQLFPSIHLTNSITPAS